MQDQCSLFSGLYIGCQTQGGDLDDFFEQEKPGISTLIIEGGNLRLPSAKSDLLDFLNSIVEYTAKQPNITAMIIDGAVVVNI